MTLGGPLQTGLIVISFSANDHYRDRLEEAARDFAKKVTRVFRSLLDDQREEGPVKIRLCPESDLVEVTFATKPAPSAEVDGLEC